MIMGSKDFFFQTDNVSNFCNSGNYVVPRAYTPLVVQKEFNYSQLTIIVLIAD